MAYEFHITRADFWADDPQPVTFAETAQAAMQLEGFSADPEGRVETVNPRSGMTLTAVLGPCVVYRDTVRIRFCGNPPTFALRDSAELAPFLALAELLGAKIQGDEGEEYTKDSI